MAPNRLAQAPEPKRAGEVWSADITCIRTAEGCLHLAGVMDLWSRKIAGWAMEPTLHTSLPLAALTMAPHQRNPTTALLHHSDRGVQYASAQYRRKLQTHAITAPMSRKACCYDNAAMESFWSTLKMEMAYRCDFATHAQAKAAIFHYIECFCNRTRLHSTPGYKSPLDYESSNN